MAIFFLCSVVFAIDFIPQGDIDLINIYGIQNATDIEVTNLSAANLESNMDGTGYNITVNELSATLVDTTNLEADNLESNIDGTGFNYTGNWFFGIFDWIVKSTSYYLTFNGTELDYNESRLNETIDDKVITANTSQTAYTDAQDIIYNNSMVIYVGIVNGTMKSYVDARDLVNNLHNHSADNITSGDFGDGNYSFDTDTLFIDSTGDKVGIGTSTPTHKLNVVGDLNVTGNTSIGSGTRTIRLKDNTTHFLFNTTNPSVFTNNLTAPYLFVNDKLGIGTTSPTHELNVVGNVNITGNVTMTRLANTGSDCNSFSGSGICFNGTHTILK